MDAIREIVRVLRESSRAAEAKVGLSGAQLFVLRQLADGGPMSLNEVAARTLTHQSSVSVVVSRLVEGGLVSRTRSGEDSRRLELALTRKGEALLRQAPGASQERLIGGLRDMSGKERKQLRLALDRWLQEVGVRRHVPMMFFEDEPPRPRRKR
jgi:DNA-binding MarR family transcriptional regulator